MTCAPRQRGPTFPRALVLILLVVALATPVSAAMRYDPRLRFRTITTPRFSIHFHQGGEGMARRLARIVEDVADRVNGDLGPADGRVHVILVNQTDLSNGWATPLPHNIIEITVAAPSSENIIGNSDDWLRLVFTHEYTHVVHLGRKRGWIGGLRGVFGRQPLLYPNLFQPLWQIEGIATYVETAQTGQGRMEAGDFRLILDRAAGAHKFEPLDRVNGGLVDWPSGYAPYLYGGLFHEYLAERYGAQSLRRLTDETARRLPYTGSRAYKKVFGRSLGTLWQEFEASAKASPGPPQIAAIRLTQHGFSVSGPRFARDGRIFYSTANPHEFPSLMEVSNERPSPRRVSDRYLGNRVALAGSVLVYDQIEYVRNVGLQSDLYAVSPDDHDNRRLTINARAADPDVSPDGRTIVCTVQALDGGRMLATMAMPARGAVGTPVALRAEEQTDFSSPRWSPDGRWIAAERRRNGGPSEIVLVDARGGEPRVLPSPAHRNASPVWIRDGTRLLFAAARDREPFQIYSVAIDTGALARLDGTGASAQSPDVSHDGSTLVFVGYTPDGYDLFSMTLDGARWTTVEPFRTERVLEGATPQVADTTTQDSIAPVTYSPLRTLAPRFWSPVIDSDADDLVLGAATAGTDVLSRHAYGISAAWSTSRGRPDVWMGYLYDRWWPTFFFEASDDTDSWGDGAIRTREVNAGLLLPFRRVRRTQTLLAAVNVSTDLRECTACGSADAGRVARRSLRGGWTFDSARTYGYSVSREDGGAVSLSVESTLRALGADGNAGAAVIDARRYLAVVPRHGVVAGRVAGASTWGDADITRTFTAAGSGSQSSSSIEFGADAVGLLRGFEQAATVGRHAVIANLDYRLPLRRVQRGVGTVPLFLRTIHGAVFVDVGEAWTRRFDAGDLKVSTGVEISFDTVVGFALPVTFAAGGAWRHDPTSRERGFAAFARIGRAF